MISKIIFLLLILVIANIFYKGKRFDKHAIPRVIFVSFIFILSGIILLINTHTIYIVKNILILGIFTFTSLLWFTFPVLIRTYGTYPASYIKNNLGNKRFMVKFELSSMTVKYFEVLFQQTVFLYLLFAVSNSILLFTLIIVLIHLGNILFMDVKWTLFYTALSAPMALLFGKMILQGNVLLTASIHLLFYLVFNAHYWFNKKYE